MSKEITAKKTAKTAEKTAAPKLNKRQLLKKELEEKLEQQFSVSGKDATDANLYNALVLVLRDRMRRSRVNYIHKAHKLRRIYGDLSLLLRDKDELSQQSRVIYLSVKHFPAELNICRSLDLLAPETVEGREGHIFKASYIDPLIKLERHHHRFAHNNLGTAQIHTEEYVVVSNHTCLGLPL